MALTFSQTLELIVKPGNEIRLGRRIADSVYDSANKELGHLRKGVLHKLIMAGHVERAKESDSWHMIYVAKDEAKRRADTQETRR
jgi:hypothetical protein